MALGLHHLASGDRVRCLLKRYAEAVDPRQ